MEGLVSPRLGASPSTNAQGVPSNVEGRYVVIRGCLRQNAWLSLADEIADHFVVVRLVLQARA